MASTAGHVPSFGYLPDVRTLSDAAIGSRFAARFLHFRPTGVLCGAALAGGDTIGCGLKCDGLSDIVLNYSFSLGGGLRKALGTVKIRGNSRQKIPRTKRGAKEAKDCEESGLFAQNNLVNMDTSI